METSNLRLSPIFEVGVVVFPDVDAAEGVLDGLRQMGATHLVNDVSVLQHHSSGRFSVHAYSDQTSRGANIGMGAVVGTLVGALMLGPFGVVAGLIGGGAVGASFGGRKTHDLGLSDRFVDELRSSLPPGSSAVLIAGEPDRVEELLGHVRKTNAVIAAELREPLTDEQAQAIRRAIEDRQHSE